MDPFLFYRGPSQDSLGHGINFTFISCICIFSALVLSVTSSDTS